MRQDSGLALQICYTAMLRCSVLTQAKIEGTPLLLAARGRRCCLSLQLGLLFLSCHTIAAPHACGSSPHCQSAATHPQMARQLVTRQVPRSCKTPDCGSPYPTLNNFSQQCRAAPPAHGAPSSCYSSDTLSYRNTRAVRKARRPPKSCRNSHSHLLSKLHAPASQPLLRALMRTAPTPVAFTRIPPQARERSQKGHWVPLKPA